MAEALRERRHGEPIKPEAEDGDNAARTELMAQLQAQKGGPNALAPPPSSVACLVAALILCWYAWSMTKEMFG